MRSGRGWMIATGVMTAIAIAAIAWAIVSMGDANHGDSAMAHDMPGHSMAGDAAMPTDDRAFIEMMVPHHQMALDMARIELQRGTDAEVRAFAKAVVADQSREIAQMRAWYRDWYGSDVPDMPMGEDMAMMGMDMDMDALRSTSEPDRAFLAMMQPHHAGAVIMANAAMGNSQHPALANLQKRIVAAQSAEMGTMQQMRERIAPPLG